MITSQAAIHI